MDGRAKNHGAALRDEDGLRVPDVDTPRANETRGDKAHYDSQTLSPIRKTAKKLSWIETHSSLPNEPKTPLGSRSARPSSAAITNSTPSPSQRTSGRRILSSQSLSACECPTHLALAALSVRRGRHTSVTSGRRWLLDQLCPFSAGFPPVDPIAEPSLDHSSPPKIPAVGSVVDVGVSEETRSTAASFRPGARASENPVPCRRKPS